MAGIGQWLRGLLPTAPHPFPESERPEPLPQPQPSVAWPHAVPPPPFLAGNNDFGIALYHQLGQKPGNLFFSPFSIRTALGMTYAGAKGKTAEEMAGVLRFPPSDEELHAAFATLIARLNAAGGGMYEMAVANSLWAQEGSPMLAGFAELVARHYGGGLFGVDFKGAAEAARARINRWVEERTREKIRDLIPPDALDPLTALVLVNAVYFKGKWSLPFLKEDTRDQPFSVEGGGKVLAPLMFQQDRFLYAQGDGFQAVDLAYRGGDLSMVVLLPEKRNGLRKLERMFSPQLLYDCSAQMDACTVNLFLPRFKVVWGTEDIGAVLSAMEMPTAFVRGEADFSGINGFEPPDKRALNIAKVFHKAFVETNEEGTEAAAATAVIAVSGAWPAPPAPVPVFRADHPFLFAIRERRSNAILFLGRVADPTRES
jgi:serpin B